MGASEQVPLRELSVGMRRLLVVASVLVFLAGFQLFILSEQTDHYFAWTIQPAITAAFLGAGYWSSFLLEFLASRERHWARARVAVPAVFTFTTLTLVATLLHFDRFHFGSSELLAQVAAWFWLVIYLVVPPTMFALWVREVRLPGGDSQRSALLPLPMRVALAAQTCFMLGIGLALFISPPLSGTLWPWKLTPLTARAVGAWLIGVGVFAGQATWENDFSRVKAGMVSYLAFGVLQIAALGRFPLSLAWSQLPAWVYIVFIVSVLIVGIYGVIRAFAHQ